MMMFLISNMHCILSFSRFLFHYSSSPGPICRGVGLINAFIFSFSALTWGTRISTLGSDSSGGSVYVLNLVEPLDFNRSIPVIRRRIHEVASFNCSIWTADCESSGGRAVIGMCFFWSLYSYYHAGSGSLTNAPYSNIWELLCLLPIYFWLWGSTDWLYDITSIDICLFCLYML